MSERTAPAGRKANTETAWTDLLRQLGASLGYQPVEGQQPHQLRPQHLQGRGETGTTNVPARAPEPATEQPAVPVTSKPAQNGQTLLTDTDPEVLMAMLARLVRDRGMA